MADDDDPEMFDLEVLEKNLTATLLEDGSLEIDMYIEAYRELCKFFDMLGSIFSFVTSDVKSKMGILTAHRKSELSENYKTIEKMVAYEVANDLTKGKVNGQANGSRTLLRLHRAFEFFILFMEKTVEAANDDKLSGLAGEAYNTTLAKHHGWMIRKTVNLALYALPTRKNLLVKMKRYQPEQAVELLKAVIPVAQTVYEKTQKIYEENNILDLP